MKLAPVLVVLVAISVGVGSAVAQPKMEAAPADGVKAEVPKKTVVKKKAKARTFEAPAEALAPKGTVQGRMVSPGFSATCTSTDGKSTCTCEACWASDTGCGCPTAPVVQDAIKSGAIKFRDRK
jgi:hypothetical protein